MVQRLIVSVVTVSYLQPMKLSSSGLFANAMASFLMMLFLYLLSGIFTVVNQQFQVPLQSAMLPGAGAINNALVMLLNFSWFLAYPLSQGISTRWLNRYGYARTALWSMVILVVGLAVYEIAVLLHLYMPSGVTMFHTHVSTGFFIFLLGSFIVGVSTTVFQVVMNLYLTVVDVGSTTPLQRQMIGGTTNAAGMAVAPIVVSSLLFAGVPLHLVSTRDFIVPLIVLVFFMSGVMLLTRKLRLPPVDADSAQQGDAVVDTIGTLVQPASPRPIEADRGRSLWSFPQFRLGVWAIFFYVGVEVAVGANINMYAVNLGEKFAVSATKMAALYWTGLLVGRLCISFFSHIAPRTQLVYSSIGAMMLILLAVLLRNPWILSGVGLFHSVMWPAIFTIAIENLGHFTTRASGVLMIGVLGGGVIPLLQGVVVDLMGGHWQWSWCFVALCELYVLFYARRTERTKNSRDTASRKNIV